MSAKAAALEQIKARLGSSGIIADPADMKPYLVSWRNGWEGKAPFIARPSDTKQVSDVLAICYQNDIAIVPQGGNTGLVGGAIPSPNADQLVLNLSRMNKIRGFDQIGSAVTVEAGVILQTLQDEADKAGFLFPLSMASEGSAQIGGAISTNAGGTAVLRYGNMRELVLGLEIVLPNGAILAGLKSLPKDNAGYNFAHHFIGAEGTLGIVTAATLKLFPKLNQVVTGIVAVDNPTVAMRLLGKFRAMCGEHLNAFEMISDAAMGFVLKHIPGTRLPFKEATPYYILIELGSSSDDIPLRALFETLVASAMDKGDARDAVIAENSSQTRQFWMLRENVSEALRKQGSTFHFDISVPLSLIAEFLESMDPRIKAISSEIIIAPFGHLGDGNLHYNMYCPSSNDPVAHAQIRKQIQDLVYGEVTRLNGSISAEHGIGVERKTELKKYKQPEAIAFMQSIKKAIDPKNIMNPGKIFDGL